MLTIILVFVLAQTASAQTVSETRAAVTRALPILQRSAGEFVSKRACLSCHHNSLAVMTFHLAQARGFTVDPEVLSAVEEKTFRQLRIPKAVDDVVQAVALSDPTPTDSYLLMAAHSAGLEEDLVTALYVRRILGWQRDGHWVTSDFRPPSSSSLFTATATAVRAIRLYGPPELRARSEASVASARQWLFDTRPTSTEDAAFRLMGLAWSGATQSQIAGAQRDLLALQKAAGGWPQLPSYEPDAYSTGEALFALHEAGIPPSDSAFRRGIRFLISTQAPKDGTWHVRSRMLSPAEVSPTYFRTGFPYGTHEFLSYAGSCWAVMALLTTLPEPAAEPSRVASAPPDVPSWARTALLGPPDELAALLDAGLDPNSKTDNGTTLLMMGAPDAEKVRLLLARGADAGARAASGADALAAAAGFYGTTASLQALLDAGAAARPPEDVRVRKSPLDLASMTGDLQNVKLLLAHGADASEGSALADAITTGYADVVRALVLAGANLRLVESSGINLLHWAAITNRSAVIPVLAEAGVSVNVTDAFGFTPLMYAATIDFGDVETLKELLKAGASRTIKNYEDRTPIEQAAHFKHAALRDALR